MSLDCLGWRGSVAAVALVAAIGVTTPPAAAELPESSEPIRIVTNNWGSQLVLSNVTGNLLERLGYSVEYVPSNTQVQFPAIGRGEVHVQVEVWEGTMRTPFEEEVAAGRMIDAGSHVATTREEWWYPIYMEETCPGLPDWQALQECHALFAVPETAPKGRYLGGAVEWEKHDEERIEALGMDFEVIYAGSTSALIAELQAAYDRKEPLVMFNYKPNWVLLEYEGRFVEFPDWAAECETDPSWGTNPELTYDCGNADAGWLKKAAYAGLAESHPCALELLRNISFNDQMIGDAFYLMDVDNLSEEEGAAAWLEKYGAEADSWIADLPDACSIS